MEHKAVQPVHFTSRTNPGVKVLLEFAGEADSAAVEAEITDILTKKYLETFLQESLQNQADGLLSLPVSKEGGERQ